MTSHGRVLLLHHSMQAHWFETMEVGEATVEGLDLARKRQNIGGVRPGNPLPLHLLELDATGRNLSVTWEQWGVTLWVTQLPRLTRPKNLISLIPAKDQVAKAA